VFLQLTIFDCIFNFLMPVFLFQLIRFVSVIINFGIDAIFVVFLVRIDEFPI